MAFLLPAIMGSILCLSTLLSCAPTELNQRTAANRLPFDKVPLRPGAVAWAPDGSRFAVIQGGRLCVHDPSTGQTRTVNEFVPVFLCWDESDWLFALGESPRGKRLYTLERNGTVVEDEAVAGDAVGIRCFPPTGKPLVFSARERRMSIGTFITFHIQDIDGRDLHTWESYFPTRASGLDFWSGLTYPGLQPVHDTLVIPEFHDPPALSPFIKFVSFDPLTRELAVLFQMPARRPTIRGSWSPDGTRLAVTNDDGHLLVIDMEHPTVGEPVSWEISGETPSWNPAGSQIYLGGWLVEPDGRVVRNLISGANRSMGLWSPDGTRLLVTTDHGAYLLRNISPSFHDPDTAFDEQARAVREKVRTLKALYRDGLVSQDEFRERRDRLIGSLKAGTL